MFNTPADCYKYIIDNDIEMPVLGAMMNHAKDYSIAEIADGRFHNRDGVVSFSSPGYKVNIAVTDDEIVTAVLNGLYAVSYTHLKFIMLVMKMEKESDEELAEKSADSKNMNRSDLSARHKQILTNMDIGVEYSTEQIAEKI